MKDRLDKELNQLLNQAKREIPRKTRKVKTPPPLDEVDQLNLLTEKLTDSEVRQVAIMALNRARLAICLCCTTCDTVFAMLTDFDPENKEDWAECKRITKQMRRDAMSGARQMLKRRYKVNLDLI